MTRKKSSYHLNVLGPGKYHDIAKEIKNKGQELITGHDIIQCLYDIICNPDLYSLPENQDIRNKLRSNELFYYNCNILTDKGIYVISDIKGDRCKALLELNDLNNEINDKKINQLEHLLLRSRHIKGIRSSEHKKIRFAKLGDYKAGTLLTTEFRENDFLTASFGLDNINKLITLTFNMQNSTQLHLPTIKNRLTLSAITIQEGALHIYCDGSINNLEGYAITLHKK